MTAHDLDAAREAYERRERQLDELLASNAAIVAAEFAGHITVLAGEADAYIQALEAALAAQVERTRILSNERELLLRYGRAMHERMELEGLNTIAMMQIKAVLDKEDANHD